MASPNPSQLLHTFNQYMSKGSLDALWLANEEFAYSSPSSLNYVHHPVSLTPRLDYPYESLSPSNTSPASSPERTECDSESSSSGSDSEGGYHGWRAQRDYPYSDLLLSQDAPYMPPDPSQRQATISLVPPLASESPLTANLPLPPFPDTVSLPEAHSSRACHAKANSNLSSMFVDESDIDAEGESDDGGSEDEYVPSPRLPPRERRSYQYAYNNCGSRSPSGSPVSMSPRFATPPARDNGRFRRTKPRHQQTSAPISIDQVTSGSNRWKCPSCPYVQKNRRMPDFKRHLQTHTRYLDSVKWVCCGLPVHHSLAHRASSANHTMEWEGQMMVGGCWKVFSRRDAYKRHLDNKNISCVGDTNGTWLPGNRC